MRSLSTTTALLTSLALAVPATFPSFTPARAQEGSAPCVQIPGGDCVVPEGGMPEGEAAGDGSLRGLIEQLQSDESADEAAAPEAAPEAAEESGDERERLERLLADEEEAGQPQNERQTQRQERQEQRREERQEARQQAREEAQEERREQRQEQRAQEEPQPAEEPQAEEQQAEEQPAGSLREVIEREQNRAQEAQAQAPETEEQTPEDGADLLRQMQRDLAGEEQGDEPGEQPAAEGTPLTAEEVEQIERTEARQAERRAERQRLRQEAREAGLLEEAAADQSAAGDGVAEAPSDAELEAATGTILETMAGSGNAEVVEEETRTIGERDARRSSDDFTRAETRRQERRDRREEERAAQAQRDDADDVRNILGGVIVGAAGALIVGSLLSDDREVVSTAPDRIVVRDQYGNLQVLRDDDSTLRQPGSDVTTRRFSDGSTETIVNQEDGTQVITVRDAQARVVRRVHVGRDGLQTVLFDDTVQYQPVVISELPPPNRTQVPDVDYRDQQALRQALLRDSDVNRGFSLSQIRQIDRVRYLAPSVQVENITFATGSAAVTASQAEGLLALGQLMASMIQENPNEVFLIEGHTDAVGSAVSNLTLSDRRAESVARALTEYFGVPPENMVLQGYGETDLRVATEADERLNRRVVVRRLTPLLQVAQAN